MQMISDEIAASMLRWIRGCVKCLECKVLYLYIYYIIYIFPQTQLLCMPFHFLRRKLFSVHIIQIFTREKVNASQLSDESAWFKYMEMVASCFRLCLLKR